MSSDPIFTAHTLVILFHLIVVGGLHASMEDSPNTSMFTRVGGSTPHRKNSQSPVTK